MHMERPWDKSNTDPEPGKAEWLVKKNLEEMPRKCDSHYHRGCDSLSLSSPMCLSTRTFFFPPKTHFPCFTTFCPYVEILFYRALLLVNFPDDLVARIQHSRCRCPTSNSGHQPKSCLKQQAKATQNQFPINNWTIQAWLQDGESLHWYLIYKKCAIFFFFFYLLLSKHKMFWIVM